MLNIQMSSTATVLLASEGEVGEGTLVDHPRGGIAVIVHVTNIINRSASSGEALGLSF